MFYVNHDATLSWFTLCYCSPDSRVHFEWTPEKPSLDDVDLDEDDGQIGIQASLA